MSNDMISVVIPCFNQGKYLPFTVESIIASTHQAIEIIIVNDGSTDDSLAIAQQLKSRHHGIQIIHQPNGGVSKARNAGMRIAQGEYILPLDGDDLISRDYIEKAIEILRSNSSVKVVYCNAVKFNEQVQKEWKLKPFNLYNLATDNMIFVSGIFRKKDAFDIGGYSEDMTMGREDWEFWIKMLKDGGQVVKLPITGFYYRLTPNSKRKRTGTKEKKKERIDYLNQKHPDFFHKSINGPLRYNRSWSYTYNTLMKLIGRL
jgi:glycosyltransferase involved in cell wall biosynthesis